MAKNALCEWAMQAVQPPNSVSIQAVADAVSVYSNAEWQGTPFRLNAEGSNVVEFLGSYTELTGMEATR